LLAFCQDFIKRTWYGMVWYGLMTKTSLKSKAKPEQLEVWFAVR